LKKVIAFWKKDVINKLIVGVLFLLLAGVVAFVYMIVHIPGGKSLGGIVSQFMISPTPTTDVNAVFTSMAETAIVESTPAYMRGPATITPIGGGSTATSFFTFTPTSTATSSVLYTSTPSPTLKATVTPTSSGLTVAGVNCIPAGTPKTGQVLDILDGVSAKIMIDGLVYTIHYVGVDLPAVAGYAEAASMVNGNLVFQHNVQIYEDPVGNNSIGTQYRYLVVDGKLVNLELIRLGLVSVVDLPSGFACHQPFLDAENAAKSAKVGQWK
jgi:endonuclease YncB( thermonuclease family)